ncbi:DUF4232 domain-containing protein [Kutzneria sp. NPDC051319]|uniref:DUF4232 domain-containing protein n=1 Tax=Kutzneria sp. NPDC051319 TaxID=3155047 RepID=UPI00341EE522
MTRIQTILGAVATAATAAVVLAGCGNSSATGAQPNAPATTTASQAKTPTQNASNTNGKISADLNHQQSPGSEILVVTNKGTRPITVQGWPELSFLNAHNDSLAVPTEKVSQPGATVPSTLQPGQSAFAGVKLISGDKGDPSTFVATTTNLTVPGAPAVTVSLIGDDGHAAEYPELDLKSIQVGTFQPSMQGVSPDAW